MRLPWCSRCKTLVSMENRRLCSSSSKSETLVPSSTLPLRSTALAWKSRASARDVLPDARCPARAMFRMSSVRYFDMGETPSEECRVQSAECRMKENSARHGVAPGGGDGLLEVDAALV